MSLKPLVLQWFWPHERGAYQERAGEEEEEEDEEEEDEEKMKTKKKKREREGGVNQVP